MPDQTEEEFARLDAIKESWALSRGLSPVRMSHQGAEFTRVTVSTSGGDTYEIGLRPAEAGLESGVLACATLRWKSGSRHHALRSLRQQFSFEVAAAVAESQEALDEALAQIQRWAIDSGQTLRIERRVV